MSGAIFSTVCRNRIKTVSPAVAGEKKFRTGVGIFSDGGRHSPAEAGDESKDIKLKLIWNAIST
ncbi:hypothetical protein AUJ78_01805 [Candidatus Peregrinibacteria bacterium CG1_02_41_10]|nr:MAG: hypothetical protein AUJ78_01805 [Candidatus Peregrinibacteria bacterium CG1_02_41_10]